MSNFKELLYNAVFCIPKYLEICVKCGTVPYNRVDKN